MTEKQKIVMAWADKMHPDHIDRAIANVNDETNSSNVFYPSGRKHNSQFYYTQEKRAFLQNMLWDCTEEQLSRIIKKYV